MALCIAVAAHAETMASTSGLTYQKSIELSGDWDFKPVASTPVTAKTSLPDIRKWDSINVPGNWFRQGKNISGQAWYRKRFNIGAEDLGRHVRIYFDGVDYAADVWLNGRHVGRHIGYFQQFDFDISKLVRKGGNELMVLVDSPLEDADDWSLNKRLIKGVLSHHDTRPGGAWSKRGQEMNTGGIWAPVHVEITDQLALRRVEIVPEKQSGDQWNVRTVAAIASQLPANSEVGVDVVITPDNFSGASYKFSAKSQLNSGNTNLTINNLVAKPELWWPVGHGKPNLYRMRVMVKHQGEVVAAREEVFGFREIAVSDASKLQWQVNGRRLFIRGTNYISTQWLSEMTPASYGRDLELMQQANINAIRVHAHIEAPAFYEICDRMGMLVMQDFPLQWGYSDSPEFVAEARKQAADMVHILNNHPSITSWTLHNEPPWDSPWMKEKYRNYKPSQNRQLDALLFADISALENKRVARNISATKEHVWLGWYFGEWQHYGGATTVPWITEYGAQALPDLASLQKIFDSQTLWPDSDPEWDKWAYHNFQRYETFNIAKVPMGLNIDELIRNSQAHQAKVIQLAAENYRRQRYAPVSALFQFMFNENWPSISWGVVDYWRKPKQGYEALRLAYQPVLPSIEWKKDVYAPGESVALGMWLINDTWEDLSQLQYIVIAFRDQERFYTNTLPAQVAADSAVRLNELRLERMEKGDYLVTTEVRRADGSVLGSNRYNFSVR